MRTVSISTIALAFLSSAGLGIAADTSFISDSVLAELREDDVSMLLETIDAALEAPQGEAQPWENKASGAKGTVTRMGGYSKDRRECRRLRVQTQARGRSGDGEADYCRAAYGRWELEPR